MGGIIRKTKGRAKTLKLLVLLAVAIIGISACSQSPHKSDQPILSSDRLVKLNEAEQKDYQVALEAAGQQDYQRAIELLVSLSKLRPQNSGIWFALASAYYNSGSIDDAEKALKKAATLKPESYLAHNLKGILALESGAINEAEEHFKAALKINPKIPEAHYNLALIYDTYYQDIAQAIEHYRNYLKLTPERDERTEQWVVHLGGSIES